jgi:hypothetical protein
MRDLLGGELEAGIDQMVERRRAILAGQHGIHPPLHRIVDLARNFRKGQGFEIAAQDFMRREFCCENELEQPGI